MKTFFLCFVPLFVAVDAIGVLPLFLGFTEGMDAKRVRSVVAQSVVTALAVALVFLAGGSALLTLLGVTVADFMVAGGLLLFAISLTDLITSEKERRKVDPDSLGAVPLGVPLITGPAVLTTSLLLLNAHGILPTALSLVSNIAIAGLLFMAAPAINKVMGKAGAKTVSKIASLLLAAIGVMIVRKGLALILAG
ncbi:MAG: MarC family protein [Thermodesulfobacteriota bacterium]